MRRSYSVIAATTLAVDYILIIIAFSTAYWLRGRIDTGNLVPFPDFFAFALLAGVIYVALFAYLGLYSLEKRKDLVDQFFGLIVGSLSATALAGSVIYFGRNFDYSRLILGSSLVLSVLFVWIGRIVIDWAEHVLYHRGVAMSRTLLIGSGSLLDMAIKGFRTRDGSGFQLVGLLYTGDQTVGDQYGGVSVLGHLSETDLADVITKHNIHEVILAEPRISDMTALEVINLCESMGVKFKYVPDVFDVATARVVTHDLAGMALIELRPTLLEGWMLILKRLLDIAAAIAGLVLLSPLFLITAIIIKLDSTGPVIFRHKRVGRNGVEFDLFKFRSMNMVEKNGHLVHANENKEVERLKELQPNYKLENDPRVTKVGHFIRKTSIDELPQLLNVLRGELSLVGPRAYVAQELEKQQGAYPQTKALVRRLLTVKPGITGLWQVSGRSNIDFKERVAMDAYYATQATIWMDIKILFQTIPVVIKGSGAM